MDEAALARPAAPGLRDGFVSLFRGIGFVAGRPGLWPYALVPAVLLLVLTAGFVALSVMVVGPWIGGLFSDPSSWYAGLVRWVVAILASIVGLLIAMALTPPLSGPALEKLVERQESELGVPPRTPLGFFAEMWCGLRAQLFAAIFAVPLLALLWLVDLLVPPAVVVTVPLKLAVTAFSLAWNLFDYPLTLRGIRMRDRFSLIMSYRRVTLGFGLGFAVLFWIPCFGVLMLPVGVAAATRMVWWILAADPALLPGIERPAARQF